MTKNQAIEEMKLGKKVSHRYFTEDEYIYLKNGLIHTEDGAICHPNEFWKHRESDSFKDDWFLFIEKK